jgi:hypothetical protein
MASSQFKKLTIYNKKQKNIAYSEEKIKWTEIIPKEAYTLDLQHKDTKTYLKL